MFDLLLGFDHLLGSLRRSLQHASQVSEEFAVRNFPKKSLNCRGALPPSQVKTMRMDNVGVFNKQSTDYIEKKLSLENFHMEKSSSCETECFIISIFVQNKMKKID